MSLSIVQMRDCALTERVSRGLNSELLPFFLFLTRVMVYYFSPVAVNHHRWSRYNNRHLFSHSSEDFQFKIKVLADLVSPEASFLASQMATFSLVPAEPFRCDPALPVSPACPNLSLQGHRKTGRGGTLL